MERMDVRNAAVVGSISTNNVGPPTIMSFTAKSVKQFNALPRNPRAPSGRVSNNWHFDVRYIPLEPTPSHVLFLVQLESSYIHTERLPLDLPSQSSGITFFPETGADAAPEVSKALICFFLNKYGNHRSSGKAPDAHAPWKLTTEDATLAEAVGAEFERLGVRTELCKVDVVKGRSLTLAQEAFASFWSTFKKQCGITVAVSAALSMPESIVFKNLRLQPWVGDVNDDENTKALAYTQRLITARPLSQEAPPSAVGEDVMKQLRLNLMLIESKSIGVVREEADEGNGESAIDLALRFQFGIDCTPSRQLCRNYLVKAITSPTSSASTKSRAHALLIDWHSNAAKDTLYSRYLHAAAHHANESTLLSNGDVSPAVLYFALYTLEPHSQKVVELHVQYKAVWRALEKRKEEIAKEMQKAERKRAKNTNSFQPIGGTFANCVRAIKIQQAYTVSGRVLQMVKEFGMADETDLTPPTSEGIDRLLAKPVTPPTMHRPPMTYAGCRQMPATPPIPLRSEPTTTRLDPRLDTIPVGNTPFPIRYDKLVIAVGAYSQTFNVPGVKENAHFLKDVKDARKIRSRILECFEQANQPTVSDVEKRKLLNFCIVGGGPTGVEFAAELHDLLHSDIAKHYPALARLSKINLYDVAPQILGSFDNSLVKMFVEEQGEVPFGLLVWSTGLAPNPLIESITEAKKHERTIGLLTDEHLNVINNDGTKDEDVWVIGDCGIIDGEPLPATAQVASQKGKYLAHKLNKIVKDESAPKPFEFKNFGSLAYIGNWKAIYDRPGVEEGFMTKESGRVAWLLWRSAYFTMTLSWKNKILVPFYWFLNWIFGRDLTRF
ncbi:hypothetical protein D9615_007477 [Tricholomella constricta]|uniref:FAD/NAD(P)-binding domain-containing protein n=1 Tax=Tricholomella constricta TaxID=117010 RepID=A0A8H5GXS7_9AGAR|nr:hypothetical protein D9615_007477 [Tricholomella constricta]